jgi:hypothetical protein
MKAKRKKFIALFLIFSLLTINCFPKRRGINLNVTRTDGQPIKGELIAVKENSLLLLEKEVRVDVSINISDVKIITIKGPTTVLKLTAPILLAALGAFLGGFVWWLSSAGGLGYIGAGIEESKKDQKKFAGYGALILGCLGIGVMFATDKTIQIEGMSDSEIQETLKKLRKKARIRKFK